MTTQTTLGVDIKNKVRFEKVELSKVSFIDTDLERVDFINCRFPRIYGREALYDEIMLFQEIDNPSMKKSFKWLIDIRQGWNWFKKDISCKKEDIKKIEILYRRLKHKYKAEHNETEVSNWHYGEKEMFRKSTLFRRYFPLSLSNLYWLSSGYGERPAGAGIFLLLLIVIASVLMAIAGLEATEHINFKINRLDIKSISLSDILKPDRAVAILLNTMKYVTFQKDPFFNPTNWFGETVKLFAQIFIPLQAALFALAVRNKFRR